MDDGSRLVLGGSVSDLQATRLAEPFALSTGSACGGSNAVVLRLTELDKVS